MSDGWKPDSPQKSSVYPIIGYTIGLVSLAFAVYSLGLLRGEDEPGRLAAGVSALGDWVKPPEAVAPIFVTRAQAAAPAAVASASVPPPGPASAGVEPAGPAERSAETHKDAPLAGGKGMGPFQSETAGGSGRANLLAASAVPGSLPKKSGGAPASGPEAESASALPAPGGAERPGAPGASSAWRTRAGGPSARRDHRSIGQFGPHGGEHAQQSGAGHAASQAGGSSAGGSAGSAIQGASGGMNAGTGGGGGATGYPPETGSKDLAEKPEYAQVVHTMQSHVWCMREECGRPMLAPYAKLLMLESAEYLSASRSFEAALKSARAELAKPAALELGLSYASLASLLDLEPLAAALKDNAAALDESSRCMTEIAAQDSLPEDSAAAEACIARGEKGLLERENLKNRLKAAHDGAVSLLASGHRAVTGFKNNTAKALKALETDKAALDMGKELKGKKAQTFGESAKYAWESVGAARKWLHSGRVAPGPEYEQASQNLNEAEERLILSIRGWGALTQGGHAPAELRGRFSAAVRDSLIAIDRSAKARTWIGSAAGSAPGTPGNPIQTETPSIKACKKARGA